MNATHEKLCSEAKASVKRFCVLTSGNFPSQQFRNLQVFPFLLRLTRAKHCKVHTFVLDDAIQRFVQKKLPLLEFYLKDANLEEIFLDITKGDMQ